MTVNVLGNYIKIAPHDRRHDIGRPTLHLGREPVHPSELVGELVRANGISIRKVNVYDTNVRNDHLQETRVAVYFVTSETYTKRLERQSRETSHAVVRLLRHGCAFIAKSFEDLGREFSSFQFLQQQDVGLTFFKPRNNVV